MHAKDPSIIPTTPNTPTRILQLVLRSLLVIIAAYAILALAWRWDRIGHLNDPRWQAFLTLIGLAVGCWLGMIQMRGARRFPKTAAVSLVGILFSQICFLVLVWTDFKQHPLIWRFWWLSMIAAVTSTHIIWLRIAAAPDRRKLMRFTITCALGAAVLLAVLALRSNIIADPSPPHLWTMVTCMAISAIGSFILWLRAARRSHKGIPRPVKVGWAIVGQLALVAIAFYAGRLTAPVPGLTDLLPSTLAHLSSDELNAQLATDLGRLRIVSAGIDELATKTNSLSSDLRQRRSAENRTVYTAAEEDQVRSQFMTFLNYRSALLRLLATYSGFESVRDPAQKARCMTLAYAAGSKLFAASAQLVALYRDDALSRRKLNEPDSAYGIPAGLFDRIYENVINDRNAEALAEMGAHFQANRAEWAQRQIWPAGDFVFLVAVIDSSTRQAAAHTPDKMQARLEQIISRVKSDGYTPMYAAQSVLSTWIGDTRLIEWKPMIRHEQILAMQPHLRPGDIFLERRNYFLSNAFLPGFWPHSALYIGTPEDLEKLGLLKRSGNTWSSDDPVVRAHLDEYLKNAQDGFPHTVVESISDGVVFNSLTESMHADYVAVLRPRLSDVERAKAIVKAFTYLGRPYDFEFDFFSSDKLVCTELVYRSYDGLLKFPLVKVMGRDTLPAVEIARKFSIERGSPRQELDFILFLDGQPSKRTAALADEQTFCSSVDRPRGFNE